ncbi:hypothetical protein [Aquitalea sp. ASV15]|uniref:hypothetical protein n=1 Tax=Aquitalea sp. ASV15 TaxID=2795104 RepID=UPI0018EB6A49|nr:hypothetical protein [Aquitalea sp. ASV15]
MDNDKARVCGPFAWMSSVKSAALIHEQKTGTEQALQLDAANVTAITEILATNNASTGKHHPDTSPSMGIFPADSCPPLAAGFAATSAPAQKKAGSTDPA